MQPFGREARSRLTALDVRLDGLDEQGQDVDELGIGGIDGLIARTRSPA